jgi:hypothetical protein
MNQDNSVSTFQDRESNESEMGTMKLLNRTHSYATEYIQEAQLLLVYAARNGLDLDPEVVSDLIYAKYWLEQEKWTAEQEIKFWHAFNTLTKVVFPVSVASLEATHPFRADKKTSEARRTVGVYQRSSVLLLIVLLIAHIYWSMGSVRFTTTAEYPKQIDQLQERLEVEQSRIPQEQWAESREINALGIELDRYDYLIQESLKRLTAWNPTDILTFGSSLIQTENSAGPALGKFQLDVVMKDVQFVLEVMQFYILPLLYGLLGASAFVLRSLNIAIKDLTYVVESNISYRLRIQLGGLSGLAISWFPASDSFASVGSLTPMALAFVMGYNVEILFSAMDRFISKFSIQETEIFKNKQKAADKEQNKVN